ncbi:14723_t:CDS:2 [Acaulospora morrowiae]|uniref:14723_t:CDS:1 n=1 Tax=Acaulospora morrowiae TaxID=94023 RepID=A0A9N8YPG1_9GLOM|nr:14723_t:CDS:2 [Acaulospora morrowiae]
MKQGRTNPILMMHARKNTIRTNSTDSDSFTSTKTFLGVVFSLRLWRDLWRYLCEPLMDVNRFRDVGPCESHRRESTSGSTLFDLLHSESHNSWLKRLPSDITNPCRQMKEHGKPMYVEQGTCGVCIDYPEMLPVWDKKYHESQNTYSHS